MGVIYLIRNKINGKKYIGIDRTNYQIRWKDHIRHSKKNAIQLIDKKISEYGLNNFEYKEIYRINSLKKLKQKEKYYLKNGVQIRLNAKKRYIKNRKSELLRAKIYRQTHTKVKGRWYNNADL